MADRTRYHFKQKVSEAELNKGFDLLEKADRRLASDLDIFGIITGMEPSRHYPVADLSLDLTAPGRCYDQKGRRIFFGTAQNVDVSVDENAVPTAVPAPGNERWVTVFISFDRLLSDPRTDGNSQQVHFRRDESFTFKVRQGAEAAAGSALRPPLQTEEVLVCDVLLTHGMTQVQDADIEDDRRQDFKFAEAEEISVVTGGWSTLHPSDDDVQSALDEVDNVATSLSGTLSGHVGASSGAHAASAIANTPGGGVSATDVQAAIDELDTEKSNKGHGHAAAEVDYQGSGALADGTPIGQQSLEGALDLLVDLLADQDGAGADGAARVGAEAQTSGGTSVSRGSLSSQLLELLQHIDGKGGLDVANTWNQPQTFRAEPGIKYLDHGTTMRLLLYVPSTIAPLRFYFDGSSFWITTNSKWDVNNNRWETDVLSGTHSALQLEKGAFQFHYQVGNMQNWTTWYRTWKWDLSWGRTHPIVTNGVEQGYWALQGANPYGNQAVYLGYGVNFKATFQATPSTITIWREGGYNWASTPGVSNARTHGFTVYGNSDVVSQGTSVSVQGYFDAA